MPTRFVAAAGKQNNQRWCESALFPNRSQLRENLDNQSGDYPGEMGRDHSILGPMQRPLPAIVLRSSVGMTVKKTLKKAAIPTKFSPSSFHKGKDPQKPAKRPHPREAFAKCEKIRVSLIDKRQLIWVHCNVYVRACVCTCTVYIVQYMFSTRIQRVCVAIYCTVHVHVRQRFGWADSSGAQTSFRGTVFPFLD